MNFLTKISNNLNVSRGGYVAGSPCVGPTDDSCQNATYLADPCLNGGQCKAELDSYKCLCPVAGDFGGDRFVTCLRIIIPYLRWFSMMY